MEAAVRKGLWWQPKPSAGFRCPRLNPCAAHGHQGSHWCPEGLAEMVLPTLQQLCWRSLPGQGGAEGVTHTSGLVAQGQTHSVAGVAQAGAPRSQSRGNPAQRHSLHTGCLQHQATSTFLIHSTTSGPGTVAGWEASPGCSRVTQDTQVASCRVRMAHGREPCTALTYPSPLLAKNPLTQITGIFSKGCC